MLYFLFQKKKICNINNSDYTLHIVLQYPNHCSLFFLLPCLSSVNFPYPSFSNHFPSDPITTHQANLQQIPPHELAYKLLKAHIFQQSPPCFQNQFTVGLYAENEGFCLFVGHLLFSALQFQRWLWLSLCRIHCAICTNLNQRGWCDDKHENSHYFFFGGVVVFEEDTYTYIQHNAEV